MFASSGLWIVICGSAVKNLEESLGLYNVLWIQIVEFGWMKEAGNKGNQLATVFWPQ